MLNRRRNYKGERRAQRGVEASGIRERGKRELRRTSRTVVRSRTNVRRAARPSRTAEHLPRTRCRNFGNGSKPPSPKVDPFTLGEFVGVPRRALPELARDFWTGIEDLSVFSLSLIIHVGAMATTAVLPKDVAVPEASAEDCIMVDDEEESAGSPSTKAAPTKTPTTVQGGKKRKPAAKAPPAPIGRGIAAFMVRPVLCLSDSYHFSPSPQSPLSPAPLVRKSAPRG